MLVHYELLCLRLLTATQVSLFLSFLAYSAWTLYVNINILYQWKQPSRSRMFHFTIPILSPFTSLPSKPIGTPPTTASPAPHLRLEAEREGSLPDVIDIPRWERPKDAPELISPEVRTTSSSMSLCCTYELLTTLRFCRYVFQLTRILARKERLATECDTAMRELRQALHEYDIACIDLRYAEKKRKIADEQLELARAGMFGIEFKPVTL